jgi:two-component SAPR family response regulator
LLGLDMANRLRSLGAEVDGPHAGIREAEAAWKSHRSEIAILDVNLRETSSIPLAETLVQDNVGIIFVTGYSVIADLPASLSACQILRKPVNDALLKQAVEAVWANS